MNFKNESFVYIFKEFFFYINRLKVQIDFINIFNLFW